ncbi:hypothetical protein PoB_007657900 [Plakobranchus ocellatus]|uniref:Uncharacterized protein n=1 Tax=Plakobranchus ocellatus TaxID=259542 RepID=A0AAV4E1A4_9GAST|nr:hypothetical protein PoB_007657900 [Plakobranchus ocellatus]
MIMRVGRKFLLRKLMGKWESKHFTNFNLSHWKANMSLMLKMQAVTLQARGRQMLRNPTLHQMCKHRNTEQGGDLHLCPLAQHQRRILSEFPRARPLLLTM